MFTEEQTKKFEELSKPLIEWLNNNTNPHTMILIDSDSAHVLGGEMSIRTEEFIKD